MKEMEKSVATRMFPKHVHISYAVYKGADAAKAGVLRHQLDIDGNRYMLQSTRQTAGWAGLGSNQLIQTSRGKIGEQGLRPEIFKEEEITRGGKRNLMAAFHWATQRLQFSRGGETELPADAQDILSFMYQFSQIPMNREIIPLSISDSTHLEQYQIEIGLEEELDTPLGKLRALHLRKMHSYSEAYFEIWLGLEYRLLPAKFRRLDGSGVVADEFVISDIRAADE